MDKILLAILPLLIFTLHFQEAFFLGALTALHLWLAALFFKMTAPFYPEPWKKWALLVWIGIMAQTGFYLWDLPPWWAASLYFLFPDEVFQKRQKKNTGIKIFWLGAGFWMAAVFLGICSSISGKYLSFPFFEHPAGALFALGIFSFLAMKYRLAAALKGGS